jgi:hypothetical protein
MTTPLGTLQRNALRGSEWTIIVGRRHDVPDPTNQVAPRASKQMVDVTAGTKARACRNGQQDRSHRMGGPHLKRTLYTPHCLKEKEQQVSKTREMMVHKSAANTKTPRRLARAS